MKYIIKISLILNFGCTTTGEVDYLSEMQAQCEQIKMQESNTNQYLRCLRQVKIQENIESHEAKKNMVLGVTMATIIGTILFALGMASSI